MGNSVVGKVYYVLLSGKTQTGIYALIAVMLTFFFFLSFLIYGRGLETSMKK